jgi:phospholipid/cholesterol/gamma-HCH transport system substrate-binding protein
MSQERKLEIVVGLFLLLGIVSFSYLVIKLGNEQILRTGTYTVTARFDSITGLNKGADVQIAGVSVGKVSGISLDKDAYQAVVSLAIDDGVELQDDSIASVRSTGIIGDKIVSIAPGGGDPLAPGDTITDTESSVSLEELISKYIFESDKE